MYFFSLCSTSGRREVLTSQSLRFRKIHFAQVFASRDRDREKEREREKEEQAVGGFRPFSFGSSPLNIFQYGSLANLSANCAQTQTVPLLCQAHLAGFTATQRKRETLFAARFTFSVSSQRWVQQISRMIAKDWSDTLYEQQRHLLTEAHNWLLWIQKGIVRNFLRFWLQFSLYDSASQVVLLTIYFYFWVMNEWVNEWMNEWNKILHFIAHYKCFYWPI